MALFTHEQWVALRSWFFTSKMLLYFWKLPNTMGTKHIVLMIRLMEHLELTESVCRAAREQLRRQIGVAVRKQKPGQPAPTHPRGNEVLLVSLTPLIHTRATASLQAVPLAQCSLSVWTNLCFAVLPEKILVHFHSWTSRPAVPMWAAAGGSHNDRSQSVNSQKEATNLFYILTK